MLAEGAYGGLWHVAHAVVACTPTSGKVVWLKVARFHVTSVNLWQLSQAVGTLDAMWFTGDLALL